VFPEYFREVPRKLSRFFKKVSCAWHSSQLPEQKEGLFFNVTVTDKLKFRDHWQVCHEVGS